jgi:hypothetical protein
MMTYDAQLVFKNQEGEVVFRNELFQGDVSEKDEAAVEQILGNIQLPQQEEGSLTGELVITKTIILSKQSGKMDLTEALAVEEQGIQAMKSLHQYTKTKHGIS